MSTVTEIVNAALLAMYEAEENGDDVGEAFNAACDSLGASNTKRNRAIGRLKARDMVDGAFEEGAADHWMVAIITKLKPPGIKAAEQLLAGPQPETPTVTIGTVHMGGDGAAFQLAAGSNINQTQSVATATPPEVIAFLRKLRAAEHEDGADLDVLDEYDVAIVDLEAEVADEVGETRRRRALRWVSSRIEAVATSVAGRATYDLLKSEEAAEALAAIQAIGLVN